MAAAVTRVTVTDESPGQPYFTRFTVDPGDSGRRHTVGELLNSFCVQHRKKYGAASDLVREDAAIRKNSVEKSRTVFPPMLEKAAMELRVGVTGIVGRRAAEGAPPEPRETLAYLASRLEDLTGPAATHAGLDRRRRPNPAPAPLEPPRRRAVKVFAPRGDGAAAGDQRAPGASTAPRGLPSR
ncbi:hypothetical protein JL721_9782 [Aureococcus anophagefferens]|nr:hypothetical protein JL721_9782 [Aureococcus anophagefferens]